MAVMRNAFTEGLKADMYAYGFEAYDALPTVYDKVFEVVGSDKAYNQSTSVINAGDLVEKPENEPIVFENAMEGFTVYGKNRTFAKGIEFSMEAVEDMPAEKIANLVRDYARQWGASTQMNKETFAAKFFNYGGYTAGHDVFNATITGVITDPQGDLCYDGKPFFNLIGNKRPLYPGGTATHYNSVALALSDVNLKTAYDLMTTTNNVDARGRKMALKPDTLLVPSGLRFTALNILNATGVLGSANNDINTVQNLVPNLVEWQYLTDADAWFLLKAKFGLKFHNRKPLTFDFYQDEDTKAYKATVIARWGAHVYDWRGVVASQVNTA